jgi:hypothetical protein
MYYNRYPEYNIGFVPYARKILAMLENECLAIEPIQLNLKLGGREMKTDDSRILEIAEGLTKIAQEVPREVQSRSLLHHKVGICPQCEGDMYVVSTKKAFGKPNQACQCESCNYSENR